MPSTTSTRCRSGRTISCSRTYKGFFTEVGRFLINSTLGIGGLWDIAKQEFGLQKTKVDFGQTLGKWGVGPGPFLVLPFLPPLTVRDGIGYGVDGAMDPLSYFIPFIWDRLGMRIGDTVNDRSLNLDLFQGFEETTIDMYSAVRNGYLQRRYNLIHGASNSARRGAGLPSDAPRHHPTGHPTPRDCFCC